MAYITPLSMVTRWSPDKKAWRAVSILAADPFELISGTRIRMKSILRYGVQVR